MRFTLDVVVTGMPLCARGESIYIYSNFMRLALHECNLGYSAHWIRNFHGFLAHNLVILATIHGAAAAIHHFAYMHNGLN